MGVIVVDVQAKRGVEHEVSKSRRRGKLKALEHSVDSMGAED